MKKLLAIILLSLCLVGCGDGYSTVTSIDSTTVSDSMFVVVEKVYPGWYVVYHKDTKVMYVVSCASYNCGNFTVMVDADGKPLLWEE